MAGEYRSRHPERTVLYRVLFHHFERFVAEYEHFEKVYGYFSCVFSGCNKQNTWTSSLKSGPDIMRVISSLNP